MPDYPTLVRQWIVAEFWARSLRTRPALHALFRAERALREAATGAEEVVPAAVKCGVFAAAPPVIEDVPGELEAEREIRDAAPEKMREPLRLSAEDMLSVFGGDRPAAGRSPAPVRPAEPSAARRASGSHAQGRGDSTPSLFS